jgi:CysZ protein
LLDPFKMNMDNQAEPQAIQQVVSLPTHFLVGATYPLQAIVFLAQTPQLWSSIIFPIIVNAIVGAGLYFSLLLPGWDTINHWSSGLPEWLNQRIASLPNGISAWLTWLPTGAAVVDDILRWLLAIVLLITIGLLLVQFGAIFGAPWYGHLAEQIERLRLGQVPEVKPTLGRALQDIWRAITFQVKKLGLMLVGVGLFLLLGFLPFGSGIASIGWIALGSVLVCLDFIDPPLERRRLSFRRKLGWLGRTFPASASLGWVCLVLVSIPFLNLLAVPVCLVAGTLFCCDRILPALSAEKE